MLCILSTNSSSRTHTIICTHKLKSVSAALKAEPNSLLLCRIHYIFHYSMNFLCDWYFNYWSYQICDQKFLHFPCTALVASALPFYISHLHKNKLKLLFIFYHVLNFFLSIFSLCGPQKHSVILSSHLLGCSQDLTIKFIAVQITFSAHGKKNKQTLFSIPGETLLNSAWHRMPSNT